MTLKQPPDSQLAVDPPLPTVEIVPGGAVHGKIRPPGSKSLTNRALICAAFADGASELTGALRSEDTIVMIDALRNIGVTVDVSEGGRCLRVDGGSRLAKPMTPEDAQNRPQAPCQELFIANSGTSVRFLAAALSAAGGNYRLHGVDRMHQRPIGDLVDALRPVQRGSIVAESRGGCPPIVIRSQGWTDDATIRVAGNVSSQFLSGLMMASPVGRRPIRIQVLGELVSRPYVEMTAEVMRSFGAKLSLQDEATSAESSLQIEIGGAGFQGSHYRIEPDASAASYFWAAAAITGGRVTVAGLTQHALQGDVAFCDVLERMGCRIERGSDSITVHGGPLRGIDVDMNAISDTVQTLAVVALLAAGPTRVRGVAHNRFKETDRIGDLAVELRRLGARVEEHQDGLTIMPPPTSIDTATGIVTGGLHGATLQTYHDHRMAMSLALAGLRIPGVRILDPSCTTKTYPDFFADLESLIGRAHRWHGS